MSEEEARLILADLRLYVGKGLIHAATDILIDEFDRLAASPRIAVKAIEELGIAAGYRLRHDNDEELAERANDAVLELAARIDPRIAAIAPERVALYKRALIASRGQAVPTVRLVRHAALLERLQSVATLDGTVAECGVAGGMSFLHLCYDEASRLPAWSGGGFVAIDSFEGLSDPGPEDLNFTGMSESEEWRVRKMTKRGFFANAFDVVSQRIWRDFPEAEIHRGWIPDVFEQLPERRYRMVHVDVDLYAPTLAAFEYFLPRMVAGGTIVTDDYNWPGGRQAVDEFCTRHALRLNTTDTSLAYILVN